MRTYLDLLTHIRERGVRKDDRTGTGIWGIFGHQMRFDLAAGFPLLTTKRVHMPSVVVELLWFLGGHTNVRWLQERGCRIWNPWADEDGELGPVYGKQWRSWEAPGGRSIDQLSQVITQIRSDPDSRRHVVVAWNPADLERMALPPCHCLFQFYVADGKLSCQLYQRSCDVFIGLPFNIASYALLTHLVAAQCDLEVGEFVWSGGDVHIYQNHWPMVQEQLAREPRTLPQVQLKRRPADIASYEPKDIELIGYNPHPTLRAPVAV